MADSISKAVKPQLRGLLHSQIKKNLIVGLSLCFAAGIGQYFLVNQPRKSKYAEYYRTYDVEKEFERMKNKGLFDSCGPDQ